MNTRFCEKHSLHYDAVYEECPLCYAATDPSPLPVIPVPGGALATQVGGLHYKKCKIQPIEYVHANNIGYCEGTAIKYLTRWKDKGGIEDLKKAIHFIELLIELEAKKES